MASILHHHRHTLRSVFCGFPFTAVMIITLFSFGVTYLVIGVMYTDQCPVEMRIPIFLLVKGSFYLVFCITRCVQLIFQCGPTKSHSQDLPSESNKGTYDHKHSFNVTQNEEPNNASGSEVASGIGNNAYTLDPEVEQKFEEARRRAAGVEEWKDKVEYEVEQDEMIEEIPLNINMVTLTECIIFIFLVTWFVAGSLWVFRIDEDVQYDDPDNEKTYCNEMLYMSALWSLVITLLMVVTVIFLTSVIICTNWCCSKNKEEEQPNTYINEEIAIF